MNTSETMLFECPMKKCHGMWFLNELANTVRCTNGGDWEAHIQDLSGEFAEMIERVVAE